MEVFMKKYLLIFSLFITDNVLSNEPLLGNNTEKAHEKNINENPNSIENEKTFPLKELIVGGKALVITIASVAALTDLLIESAFDKQADIIPSDIIPYILSGATIVAVLFHFYNTPESPHTKKQKNLLLLEVFYGASLGFLIGKIRLKMLNEKNIASITSDFNWYNLIKNDPTVSPCVKLLSLCYQKTL